MIARRKVSGAEIMIFCKIWTVNTPYRLQLSLKHVQVGSFPSISNTYDGMTLFFWLLRVQVSSDKYPKLR